MDEKSKGADTHAEDMKARLDARREELLSSESEAIYREIFEDSPIAIWVEDWSRVKAMIDRLARRGVKDWRRYFERRPDQLLKANNLCDIIDVSASTLSVYGAKSKEEVVQSSYGAALTGGELKLFCDEIVAVAGGATQFVNEAAEIAMDGSEVFTRIHGVIPREHRDNWSRVIFTIEDITERKRAEEAFDRQNTLFEAIFRDVPDAMVLTDPTRKIIMCNPGLTRIFGHEPEEVLGKETAILYESREEFERQGRIRFNLNAQERLEPYVVNYRRKNGEVFPGETVGTTIRNKTGETLGFISVIRDITERLRRENALRESEARLAIAHRIAKLGHWEWDEQKDRQLYCSEEGERIFGLPSGAVFADYNEFLAMIHPDDRGRVEALMDKAREDRTGYEVEYRIIRPDGEMRVIVEHSDVELDESGALVRSIGTVQDITERKVVEQRAQYLTYHDDLTGLPNRNLLEQHFEKAMAYAQRHGQHVAIHFMNLNRFKEVNDTMGHAIGDELLKAVGVTIKEVVRSTDSIARFGGDEFVVVQTELHDPRGATVLAQKLIDAIRKPFDLAGHEVSTGTTIGIAVYPSDGTKSAQLLQNATFALHAGKAKGRNLYEFFDADMRAAMTAQKRLEEDLARALKLGEFLLHYQPRIDLATGLVIGVEALVRWRHPDRGIVPPGEFIPAAEASGLIRPLGEWVLRAACKQAAAWRDAGLPPLSMAVNLSAAQFQETDLVALVGQVLDEFGLTPDQLELEITETMMIDQSATHVVPILRRLRKLGIQIAIDDFGTGYASLTYLRKFPVSKVKVDLSFVQGITHNSEDKAIVEAVIRLGHGLNLGVTAEGVETEEQATLLKAWHCDEAQGYLFGRPVPADELIALLEAQASK